MDKKNKCDIKRCKAACCTNVPIPKSHLIAFSKKITRNLYGYIDDGVIPQLGGVMVLPVTDENNDKSKNVCPFLTENYKCNIYEKRPIICRRFGEGGHEFLVCDFKNGGNRVTREHTPEERLREAFKLARYMKLEK